MTENRKTTLATFKAVYRVTNTSVKATVTEYSGPASDMVDYYLQPNSDITISGCYGNIPGCSVEAYIDVPDRDHSFNVMLDVWDLPYWDYSAINAQLINRNGIWLKESTVPYTPVDPCFARTDDSNNGTTSVTSFCCKKWKNPVSPSCSKYQSKTVVNMGSLRIDYLFVDFVLNQNKTISVKMLNYTTASNNIKQNVQLEIYSSNGKAQYCISNVTTSGKACLFKETTPKNTLIMRTSDFADGWDMASVEINGQVLTSPSLTPSNPCNLETHPYNGVGTTTAITELCCIAAANGPWPGSL